MTQTHLPIKVLYNYRSEVSCIGMWFIVFASMKKSSLKCT